MQACEGHPLPQLKSRFFVFGCFYDLDDQATYGSIINSLASKLFDYVHVEYALTWYVHQECMRARFLRLRCECVPVSIVHHTWSYKNIRQTHRICVIETNLISIQHVCVSNIYHQHTCQVHDATFTGCPCSCTCDEQALRLYTFFSRHSSEVKRMSPWVSYV